MNDLHWTPCVTGREAVVDFDNGVRVTVRSGRPLWPEGSFEVSALHLATGDLQGFDCPNGTAALSEAEALAAISTASKLERRA